MIFQGEVVQQQESPPQDLGCVVEQDSWEEGFGEFDPVAHPDLPRTTCSSAVENESGVVGYGDDEDSEDEDEITSVQAKRCRNVD